MYGCPRTSKKVVRVLVRSEVFRKQASTFLIFYFSIRIRDVSGIPSDLGKSKRQGSFLYSYSYSSDLFAFSEVRGHPYCSTVLVPVRITVVHMTGVFVQYSYSYSYCAAIPAPITYSCPACCGDPGRSPNIYQQQGAINPRQIMPKRSKLDRFYDLLANFGDFVSLVAS